MWNGHGHVRYNNKYPCDACGLSSCPHDGFIHLKEKIDRVFHGEIMCAVPTGIGHRRVTLVDNYDRDIVYSTIELDEEEARINSTMTIYVIPTNT